MTEGGWAVELDLLCHYRGQLLRDVKKMDVDELLDEIASNQRAMRILDLRKEHA